MIAHKQSAFWDVTRNAGGVAENFQMPARGTAQPRGAFQPLFFLGGTGGGEKVVEDDHPHFPRKPAEPARSTNRHPQISNGIPVKVNRENQLKKRSRADAVSASMSSKVRKSIVLNCRSKAGGPQILAP